MKKICLIPILILTLPITALAEPPKAKLSANGWYKKGIAAMRAGDPDQAQTAFENALKVDPRHSPSKYQLGRIPELKLQAKVNKRKTLFEKTIIKEIDFQDATFSESLEALNKFAIEASKDEFAPNFVVQDPKGLLKDRRVTLKLNNIPVSAALKLILDQSGAVARYDEFATVIKSTGK